MTQESKNRQNKERVTQFPSHGPRQCVRTLRNEVPLAEFTAEEIAERDGRSKDSIAKELASAKKFWMVRRVKKETFVLTDLGTRLVDDWQHPAAKDLREAFLTCSVYAEIMGRYEPAGELPSNLGQVLEVEYDVPEGAGERVQRSIELAAIEVGLIDAECRFISGAPLSNPIDSVIWSIGNPRISISGSVNLNEEDQRLWRDWTRRALRPWLKSIFAGHPWEHARDSVIQFNGYESTVTMRCQSYLPEELKSVLLDCLESIENLFGCTKDGGL